MKNAITMSWLLILATIIRSDLSWGQIGFDSGQSMDPIETLKEARASKAPAAIGIIQTGNDSSEGKHGQAVEWIPISGEKSTMGIKNGNNGSKPIHEVEMSKSLVTVEQYAECFSKGPCTEPGTGADCNWGKTDRQFHPINCVNWTQANQYARFKGARLSSESETGAPLNGNTVETGSLRLVRGISFSCIIDGILRSGIRRGVSPARRGGGSFGDCRDAKKPAGR